MLFGYLLAAHFPGDKVSSRQLLIFNGVYLTNIVGRVFNLWVQGNEIYTWLELTHEESEGSGLLHISSAVLIYVSLVLAAVYFMWTLRRPKPQ